ncbi:M1 family peptidase [Echinicola strongylocentroti]|uniref:M1 family peptidase n=1 Tax=Echinicola strongylocentroti TaxID=1795355 RepID=A0A2Z4IG38_9BACT|nr:M1 family metallopeptidase [Echinicola strongylocentroti]AWW29657.1 M1 family peptidase [Echinicola strongylocentroti]
MRLLRSTALLAFSICCTVGLQAQTTRWQQAVNYEMDVEMDVESNQYEGHQHLKYTNNSPDTLYRVFYHLYYNAFQPNSMMDVRSRTIADADRRVQDRISQLSPEEIGYLKVNSLKMDGKKLDYEHVGTILEVTLDQPILPNSTVEFSMDFEGQVPLQIRRAGRDNKEGVRYSMSQWYPKMANYDDQGWHANPYIGREFYGIWGDFDVKITIDKSYILGGTGYLQNPEEIGYGYEEEGQKVKRPRGKKLTWHFKAPQVHDFMWAADPKYTHDKIKMDNGITIHHLYIKNSKTAGNWEKLKEYSPKSMAFLSEHFGQYPYKQYSIIQGGDGGMEYPMSTLITGERSLPSLVGVTVHEMAHSWFQGVLATNEALYPWMDEGFTSYATNLTMANIFSEEPSDFPQRGSYVGYERLAKSGKEEPMTTHSDHYHTNYAYGSAAYSKGAVFVAQLGYIIGEENRNQAMLNYFNDWKFKHPKTNDIIREMEKQSGLELDWYKEYWVNSTKSIDYAVKSVEAVDDGTNITLQRDGLMPMPIDLVITYQDGSQEMVYLPLVIQRGNKPEEAGMPKRILTQRWPWTNITKEITIEKPFSSIKKVEIDPSLRMADIDRENNVFPAETTEE